MTVLALPGCNPMRWFIWLVALLSAGCATEGNGLPDQERFQGDWKVVRSERGGAAGLDEEMLGALFSFRDERVALHTAGKLWALEERFTLEPHHDPPRIVIRDDGRERDRRRELPSDWINEEDTLRVQQGRDRRLVGIYRFDADDRLTLCFIKGSDSPPWRFDSKVHRECMLLTLEKLRD